MSEQPAIAPFGSARAAPDLRKSWTERRAVRSVILTIGAWIVALVASVPLFSVLYMLIVQGGSRLSLDLFTELPPAGFELGGGFGNAIVGTLVMVAIAAVISIPVGILAATYLAELSPESKLASAARFLAKVLTGFPSILAGVFVYAILVLAMGTYSAWAENEGRGTRHRVHAHPDDRENCIANGSARHPNWRHVGCCASRRRIGAAAVHRAVQQLLAA